MSYMNRTDFQSLARIRLREAKILYDSGRYEGAYYLFGQAIECAFKACVAKQTKRYDFPDKDRTNSAYTHDLTKLLNLSSLAQKHREESAKNNIFALNWALVKDWNVESRYFVEMNRAKARDFRSAVVSRKNGIFPWIQRQW